MKRPVALSACVMITLAAAGSTRAAAAPPIVVTNAWSRPEAAGLPTGVVYMTLLNHGPSGDRLMAASSPKALRMSLHRSSMTAGMMTMTPVPGGLDLPPGRAVSLAPDGFHLMMNGLKGGLKAGTTYPVTLRFAHDRPMTIQVQVRAGAGMAMKMR